MQCKVGTPQVYGFQVKTKSQCKVTWEQKTRSAMLCRSSGVQEAVQILGLKFSSEDEKSGKVTWEQKAHSAVQEGEGGPCELLLLAQVVDLNISK